MNVLHTRDRLFLVAHADRLNGRPRLGAWSARSGSVSDLNHRSRAWRDRVDGAVAASRADDRETDGSARRLVAMGGNAVVPQVAEHIGRLIVAAESGEVAA